MRSIHLDRPIEITVALRPNDQIIGAYLEHVIVDTVFQHALDDYHYWATVEIQHDSHTIEAKSNKFIDNPDELSHLEWSFLNGRILPTIINRARMEWRIKEMDKQP